MTKHFVRCWDRTPDDQKIDLLIHGLRRVHIRGCVEALFAARDLKDLIFIAAELHNCLEADDDLDEDDPDEIEF